VPLVRPLRRGHLRDILLELCIRPCLYCDGVYARHQSRRCEQPIDETMPIEQLHADELLAADVQLELRA
jgi:hypothetical protein